MHEPFCDKRHEVELEGWERRSLFEFFGGFTEPFHGVCIRVDCTATFEFAKAQRLSVFLSLMHRSLVAAQQVENFRTRIVEGKVWRYEQVHGGSAVGRPNGTIGFADYRYRPDLREFVAEAQVEVDRVRQRTDLERTTVNNLIRYSSLPWFDFTSISHARNMAREDSAPRITFGKISERDGRRTMPVSIHAHHALVDGLHVAQFVELFERLLGEPEGSVGGLVSGVLTDRRVDPMVVL